MASTEADGLCTACDKPHAFRCGRCKSSRYCSAVCQKADWPTHKLLCATFAAFDLTTRPSLSHFVAFLFPEDERKPKVIWLPFDWREKDDSGLIVQSADYASIMGAHDIEELSIRGNGVLKRHLPDTIYVCQRHAFLQGSKQNRSVVAITGTKPGHHNQWRGPVVAFGRMGTDFQSTHSRDIDMNDFRHLTDFLRVKALFFLDTNAEPNQTQAKITGVRINCEGDQKAFNRTQFETVEIPATDSIFSHHHTSDIADRIELPIFTRKCVPNQEWADNRASFVNQGATFLHLCCDPGAETNNPRESTGWGYAPPCWQSMVGSIIVVRKDKKPLHPRHVEALCNYCQHTAGPIMAHTVGGYWPEEPMTTDAALANISRAGFIIDWFKFLNEKQQSGVNTEAPYPYPDKARYL